MDRVINKNLTKFSYEDAKKLFDNFLNDHKKYGKHINHLILSISHISKKDFKDIFKLHDNVILEIETPYHVFTIFINKDMLRDLISMANDYEELYNRIEEAMEEKASHYIIQKMHDLLIKMEMMTMIAINHAFTETVLVEFPENKDNVLPDFSMILLDRIKEELL